jgi:hypothetical protein
MSSSDFCESDLQDWDFYGRNLNLHPKDGRNPAKSCNSKANHALTLAFQSTVGGRSAKAASLF